MKLILTNEIHIHIHISFSISSILCYYSYLGFIVAPDFSSIDSDMSQFVSSSPPFAAIKYYRKIHINCKITTKVMKTQDSRTLKGRYQLHSHSGFDI